MALRISDGYSLVVYQHYKDYYKIKFRVGFYAGFKFVHDFSR